MLTHNKPFKYLLSTLALLVVLFAYDYVGAPEAVLERNDVNISERRIEHILYGDTTGGGHRYGAGVPCKSEFPQSWDDQKIIDTTKRIAANDNLNWRQEGNGYFVTEKMEDGIRVRVVMDGQRQNVITSYPTNVARNPCPANGP